MEKGSDISKTLALVLVILTVIISATSTWVLITNSMDYDMPARFDAALLRLHILKGDVKVPMQTDANAGDVKIFIAKQGG